MKKHMFLGKRKNKIDFIKLKVIRFTLYILITYRKGNTERNILILDPLNFIHSKHVLSLYNLGTSSLEVIFIDGCCNPHVFKPNHCKRRRSKLATPVKMKI